MSKQLDEYRAEIDKVDAQLVSLLEERFKVVAKISDYKRKHKLAVLDSNREKQVLNKIAAKAEAGKEVYLKEIFKEIMRQSRNWQDKNRKGK